MIVLIAFVTASFVIPVNAEADEMVWNAVNFAAFWYDPDGDLMTEELRIVAGTLNATTGDRTVDENRLVYQTSSVYQEYELYMKEGLTVGSDHPGSDSGYFIEGWMGEMYVAIDGKTNKLTKLLVEFDDNDKETLLTGDKSYLLTISSALNSPSSAPLPSPR
jgi:hypothetical protein